jgi:hypothetical protein
MLYPNYSGRELADARMLRGVGRGSTVSVGTRDTPRGGYDVE